MNQSQNAATQSDENIAMRPMKKLRILIVAGEPSSDHHGAAVVERIRAMAPNVEIVGMGGGALRDAGVTTIVDSETSGSIMGITEVLRHIPKILQSFNLLVAEVDRQKPDLAILIDFPDFNLRLAKKLAKRGVRVLYYISPQLWAWRSGRVKTMKRTVTKVAAIFPFEEGFYHRHNVDAEYVGHPFMSELPIS
ncbi:MAG: lipid-A-disaccharide synthase, partial [Deltaproteobacteria bacterium]|nr:lipid-A-disaccharide synthase [Deltaproteobacteria bacterium]